MGAVSACPSLTRRVSGRGSTLSSRPGCRHNGEAQEQPMPTRRERLEAMLAAEPRDQFLRYSLAMELDKDGEHEQSLDLLRGLAADDTPYVPAFFMAGQQLARLSRSAEARAVLADGIAVAHRQGNAHAEREMGEFLAGLE